MRVAILLSTGLSLAALASAAQESALQPGEHVQVALAGGQTRRHVLAAPEGQVLEVSLVEHGIHVALSLLGPGGTELAGGDRLLAVPDAPGPWTAVVRAMAADAAPGSYTLELLPERTAEDVDRLRFRAAVRLRDGNRLLEEGTDASVRRALETFTESRALSEAAGDPRGQYDAVLAASEAYDNMGDQRNALAESERARDIAHAIPDPGRESEALMGVGLAAAHLGRNDEGLLELRAALAMAREAGDRRREGVILVSLGYALAQQDQEEQAAAQNEEALPLLKEYGDFDEQASVENNLGTFYRVIGDGETALAHHEAALRIRQAHGPRRLEGFSLAQIGETLSGALDRSEEGLSEIQKGLVLAREAGDRLTEGWILQFEAGAIARLGRTREALADYRSALAIWREIDKPRGAAQALAKIGEIQLELGDPAAAESSLEEGVAVAHGATSPAHEAQARLGVARAALARDDAVRARSEAEQAVALFESLRAGVAEADLRASYFAVVRGAYDFYVDLLAQSGDVAGALGASERSRARTLYEALAAGDPAAAPPLAPITDVAELQRRLEPDTTLVEYSLGEARSHAWVLTNRDLRIATLPPRASIEAVVRRYVELVTARNAPLDGTSLLARVSAADAALIGTARELSQMVLGPLALPQGDRLVVIADGALQYVPFAALPAPGSGEPLIQRREIVVLPSLAVLGVLRQAHHPSAVAGAAVAVLADPVFRTDDARVASAGLATPAPRAAASRAMSERVALRSAGESGLGELSRLRFSRSEAEAIGALARGRARVYLDFAASREAVATDEVGAARIVHFATHGLLNSRHPELSGIVLSMLDEHGAARDGFLRLADIQKLHLRADLVVLSACQTALGKDVRGEGLVGLTRGFMVAGASRVAASLWRVNDQATAELMKRFYAGMLDKGLAPSAALREAQRALAADPRWSAPYYWAPFALYGDWK